MKKWTAILTAGVLSLSLGTLTACEKKDSSAAESKPAIPEFSIPENILGADSSLVPASVEFDKYKVELNENQEFVKNLEIGWNLGNTFDASDCGDMDLEYEKAWCGVYTTIEDIAALKAAGFKTIRIPVSWHNHVDENFKISEAWMARVKEVVDWCRACDLYVIVNTHHDNAEAYYYPDSAHLESSKKYLGTIWQQMADAFAEYDDHLILESMNEPRLVGTNVEWWCDPNSAECQDAVQCINTLNQLFVDTVRKSGGNNANRYLLCPGYDASVDGCINDGFVLPTDSANRVIVSVHAYTPYDFALNKLGTAEFDYQSASDIKSVTDFMDSLCGKFILKGTPVLIGEFGALDKGNLQTRVEFAALYVAAARSRGLSCCWWDNNAFSGSGENFGLLYRESAKFMYPEIVQALMKYSK